MDDLVFVAAAVALFAAVRTSVRAPHRRVLVSARRGGWRASMTVDNVLGLVFAVAVLAYLVAALLFRERM